MTTISGSLARCLRDILQKPQTTLELLAGSLPGVCAFFSCYVFMKAFTGLPLELCRGVAACQQLLRRLCHPSATPRDRRADVMGLRDFENPGWFSFGKYGAQDLLVVVIMMAYAVMAPVILIPGILFFAGGAVVYRHQLLYVYEPIFESGGLLWPRIYRRMLFSLFIMQFTLAGLFLVKGAQFQAYLCLGLAAATYLYKMRMRSLFAASSSVAHRLPMELAIAMDEDREGADASDAALLEGLAEYVQPCLRPDDDYYSQTARTTASEGVGLVKPN